MDCLIASYRNNHNNNIIFFDLIIYLRIYYLRTYYYYLRVFIITFVFIICTLRAARTETNGHGMRRSRLFARRRSFVMSFLLAAVVSLAYTCAISMTSQIRTPSRYIHPRFTIFACPKGPNHTQTAVNEEVALASWVFWLDPPADLVLLIGFESDSGLQDLARKYGDEAQRRERPTKVKYVRLDNEGIIKTSDGDVGPNLRFVFSTAKRAVMPQSEEDIFTYVNADIVLPSNFVTASHRSFSTGERTRPSEIVLTGTRTDCKGPLQSAENLLKLASSSTYPRLESSFRECLPHAPTGKDYWIYRREFWERHGGIPDFMLGRFVWDDYMALVANTFGMLIDLSPVTFVIHLEHEYGHTNVRTRNMLLGGEGRKRNKRLMDAAWQVLAPNRDDSHLNLNSVYWRACPIDNAGINFIVEPAATWAHDAAWLNNTKSFPHSEGSCDYGKLFGCTTTCGILTRDARVHSENNTHATSMLMP